MLDILCHECGTQMRLPDDWAGKKGKCPKCGSVLQIGPAAPTLVLGPIAEVDHVATMGMSRACVDLFTADVREDHFFVARVARQESTHLGEWRRDPG